jgi:hypothetical protein
VGWARPKPGFTAIWHCKHQEHVVRMVISSGELLAHAHEIDCHHGI